MAEFDPVFLKFRGREIYVGQWLAGEPVGDFGFTRLPAVPPLSDALSPRDRLDVRTAGAAFGRKPRFLYDGWLETRGALAGFIATEAKLAKAGFTKEAMQGELWKQAGEELSLTAREAADEAFDAHDFIAKSREKLAAEFFEAAESETERTMRDLAIVQRYRDGALPLRAQMQLDGAARLLAALGRVPAVISGATAAELASMRAEYLEGSYPHSTAAFAALEDALSAPRQSAHAALVLLEMGCGRLPQDTVATWGPCAGWILRTEEDRQRATTDALRAAVGLEPLPPGANAPATA